MKRKNITGIDILRIIALLGVIFYHISPTILPGGYLGVLIFFVISGYLVTNSLLQEYSKNRRIDWKAFVSKRIRRIFPLLLTVFMIASFFFYIFQPKMLIGIRESFISSILSVNNWWQITNGSSYFLNFAVTANNAFKHIYFLSIEGQFYLILAFFLLLLPKKKAKVFNVIVILLFAVASAVGMALLFKASDPTRVYYGTDTRIFAPLLGVALAFAFRRWEMGKARNKLLRLISLPIVLILLSAVIMSMFIFTDKSVIIYQGGMFIYAVLICALIYFFARPGLITNKITLGKVSSYLASRAYGIYLWQLPVFVVLENWNINTSLPINIVWELALILFLSEVSYRIIEKPSLTFDFSKMKSQGLLTIRKVQLLTFSILLLLSLAIILPSSGQAKDIGELQSHLNQAKEAASKQNQKIETALKEKQKEIKESSTSTMTSSNVTSSSALPSSSSSTLPSSTSSSSSAQTTLPPVFSNSADIGPEIAAKAAAIPVVAVGDSVLIDVSSRLQSYFPNMYIDGLVGRHTSDGVGVLQALPAGVLASAQKILVNLGINGEISQADVSAILQIAGDRPVFWVNVRVDRSWEAGDNAVLAAASSQYSNLHIIDWYSVSKNHPEYFVSDGVHLTTDGISIYSNLVTNAITGNQG